MYQLSEILFYIQNQNDLLCMFVCHIVLAIIIIVPQLQTIILVLENERCV